MERGAGRRRQVSGHPAGIIPPALIVLLVVMTLALIGGLIWAAWRELR